MCDSDYFLKDFPDSFDWIVRKIEVGYQYAAAPGIMAYYTKVKEGGVTETVSVFLGNNGTKLWIREGNDLARVIKESLDVSGLSLKQATKKLPKKLNGYSLDRVEDSRLIERPENL